MNLKIVLNTHKNPYLNQATQKILAKIFQPQKIPKFRISLSKKSFLSLEILGTPPPWDASRTHFSAYQEFLWIMASAEMYKRGGGGGGGGSYIRRLLASPPIPPPLFPFFLFSTPFDP